MTGPWYKDSWSLGGIIIVGIVVLAGVASAFGSQSNKSPQPTPTPTASIVAEKSPSPTSTPSPSATATPKQTLTPTPKPTLAPTPQPVVVQSTPAPTVAPQSCTPLSNEGTCYEPGEYCRDSDHGATGVAGDGKQISCEYNNGWRWEAI